MPTRSKKPAKGVRGKPAPKSSARGRRVKAKATPPEESDENGFERESPVDDDAYEDPLSEEDDDVEEDEAIDSDALDDEANDFKSRKRKRGSLTKKRVSLTKRKKVDEQDDDGSDLKEGQEVVGTVIQAPTTGRGVYALLRP